MHSRTAAPPKAGELHTAPRRASSLTAPSFGGQALDKHTQATMTARFGHDFSSVRVHTDSRAEDSAALIGANAYAVGTDIVFGAGRYTPSSPETERLLAHELTHIAQQGQFGPGEWGRTSHKGDASEREADGLASQVLRGQSVRVQAAPQAAVARDEEDPPDVPDTPAIREKEKPGGPNDWGDKSLGATFDHFGLPKSLSLDPGMGDPLNYNLPGPDKPPNLTPPVMLPPSTVNPHPGMCTTDDPGPAHVPMAPAWQPSAPITPGSGLLGKPYDPSQPYGDPSTWQPSPFAPGAF